MNIDPAFTIPLSAINGVSAFACATLFYLYFRIPDRGLGLMMIIVLAISDFIFHITQIAGFYCTGDTITLIISGITEAAFNFSLLWTSNMAYFTYRFIHLKKIENPHKYLLFTLISLVLLSICITLIGTFLGGIEAWALVADIPGPLTMIITCLLNLKSISTLKKTNMEWSLANKTIRVLYRYAFIQVLTVGPVTIFFLLTDITQLPLSTFCLVTAFLLSFAGLANTVVYFFQRSQLMGSRQEKSGRESEMSSVLSFVQNPPMTSLETLGA